MKTIWKYLIKCDSLREEVYPIRIQAPIGAKPLSVIVQHGDICVYMEIDTTVHEIVHTLYCVGTGFGAVPKGARFLGTVVDGNYVWHLYY